MQENDTYPQKQGSKLARRGDASGTNKSNVNRVTIEDDMADMMPNRGSNLSVVDDALESEEEMNQSDIDFNAPYSDDDETIPIEEKKVWEYQQELENYNLFEMNLLQELQQSLEIQERKSKEVVRIKRGEIDEIQNNIHLKEETKVARNDSLNYYKNMLDSSTKNTSSNMSKTMQKGRASGLG